MKKGLVLGLVVTLIAALLVGCSGTTPTAAPAKTEEPIVMVWYPNESGAELKDARDEVGKIIETATGRKVEHKLTTDYVIAIEALASGNGHIGFFGAEGYLQAHTKNAKVLPLVVNSGASGTLKDAVYYSWLNVRKGEEGNYKTGDKYAIDNIAGKKFSFVSNSSTSGFKVPSSGIVSYFSKQDKYKDLKQEDLIEPGKFFSEVHFGGSHQGSAVNLLSKKVDVAAFCDTCVANYVELAEGPENTAGSIYKVKKDAAEPFNTVPGAEFVIISSTPVLNAPFIYNSDKIDQATKDKLVAAFTSDATTNNPKVFFDKASGFKGLWAKGQKFLAVEDSWFDPIRKLSN